MGRKLAFALAMVAVGMLLGSLAIGPSGRADANWVPGDLGSIAFRLGVQPQGGQYDRSAILHALADQAGIRREPCIACLDKLNRATYSGFLAIDQIGPERATALVAAQPFVVPVCAGRVSIESALDAVPGIGEVLRERIARHFCPELY